MTDDNSQDSSRTLAAVVHLTAATGPLLPLGIWLSARRSNAWTARESAKALNFSVLAAIVFVIATLVRELVPFVGFLGTLTQLAVLVVAVVLCVQAFRSVRRGLPATYPYDIKVVKTRD